MDDPDTISSIDDIWKNRPDEAQLLRYLTLNDINETDITDLLVNYDIDLKNIICFYNKPTFIYYVPSTFGIWIKNDDTLYLEQQVINTRCRIRKTYLKPMQKLYNDEDNGNECKQIYKILTHLIKTIGKSSVKSNVVLEILKYLYNNTRDLNIKQEFIDNKIGYAGFNDGVYDFKNNIILSPSKGKELYISKVIDCDYSKIFEITDDIQTSYDTYISQIFPDTDIKDFVFKLFNKALQGQNVKKVLIHYNKIGNNGKTRFFGLVGATFKQYYVKVNNKLLSDNKVSVVSPNEELMSLKTCNIACYSEPDDKKPINMSIIKDISGGDDISGTIKYGHKDVFECKALHNVLCNEIPPMDSDNITGLNRFFAIPWISKFTDDISLTDSETGLNNNVYLENENIKVMFDDWKLCLIKDILNYTHKSMIIPDKVKISTKNLKDRENYMSRFLSETIIFTNDGYQYVSGKLLWEKFDKWRTTEDVSKINKSKFLEKLHDHLDEKYYIKDSRINCIKVRNSWSNYDFISDCLL